MGGGFVRLHTGRRVGENKMLKYGNYTGPNWSNGLDQESVVFGEAPALDELDELSRLHDTAYAVYKDERHRRAADNLYAREAKRLGTPLSDAAGNAVQYGNYTMDQGSKLLSNLKTYGPLGVFKFGFDNFKDQLDMVEGRYLEKETKDVLDLYDLDPWKKTRVPMKDRKVELRDEQLISGKKGKAPVSTIPMEVVKNVKFKPVVDVRPMSHGATAPVPIPQRRILPDEVVNENAGTGFHYLPNGKKLRKKKRKGGRLILPELKPKDPTPRLAGLVNPLIYRDTAERQPIVAGPLRDFSWNVNPLKMKRRKNKVQPAL